MIGIALQFAKSPLIVEITPLKMLPLFQTDKVCHLVIS